MLVDGGFICVGTSYDRYEPLFVKHHLFRDAGEHRRVRRTEVFVLVEVATKPPEGKAAFRKRSHNRKCQFRPARLAFHVAEVAVEADQGRGVLLLPLRDERRLHRRRRRGLRAAEGVRAQVLLRQDGSPGTKYCLLFEIVFPSFIQS